jgi:hypothetical protein
MTIHNTFVTDIVWYQDLLFRNDDGEAVVCQLIACEDTASVPMRLVARLFELALGLSFRRGLLPFCQDETLGIALLRRKSRGRFLLDKIGSLSLRADLEGPNPV